MGRVDDDDGQPAGGGAQRLDLGLALGADVGDACATAGSTWRSSAVDAARRRADRGHRRGVDDALDARAQRLLEHDPRALDVDAAELVGAGAQDREPGDVEDAVDALQRAAHRAAVEQVGR